MLANNSGQIVKEITEICNFEVVAVESIEVRELFRFLYYLDILNKQIFAAAAKTFKIHVC